MFIFEDVVKAICAVYGARPDPVTGLPRMQRGLRRMQDWTFDLCNKAERFNNPVLLKSRMLADPDWKARVLKELSGVAALARTGS